jgi:hypothetical protein
MLKLADSIQMSFNITESDKKYALQIEEHLYQVINLLGICKDHLNIIQDAFKDSPEISADLLHEKRGLLNRYKQQIKKNFEELLQFASLASHYLEFFGSDSHIIGISSSFEEDIKELEKNCTQLLEILDDYRNPEFVKLILNAIKAIEKKSAQIEQLIKDRMVAYLDDNILAKNWKTNTFDNHPVELEEHKPELMQIVENTGMPIINKRQQSLNPADNQRISTPTDIREVPEHDDVGKFTNPSKKRF